MLHIVDLQIAPDVVWSSLLELQQEGHNLNTLWNNYANWCSTTGAPKLHCNSKNWTHTHLYIYILNMVLRVPFGGVPHASRASHKLFSKKILRPSTTSYTHISQKVLKGVAARFVIYWLRPLLHSVALADGGAYAVRLVN